MPSIKDSRFGIAEHLAEQFSTNCSSICNQPNIDPSLKAACDTGSQAYCSTGSNIISSDCQTYLDRVIQTRSRVLQKELPAYSNPVGFSKSSTQSITDYYNALGDAASSYITSNIGNLSTSAEAIINIMNAEKGETTMLNKVANNVIASCISSTDASCVETPFIKKRVSESIVGKALEFANADLNSILQYIDSNQNHYQKFISLYDPIHSLIAAKLNIQSLVNPLLLKIRPTSQPIRIAMDNVFILEVKGSPIPLPLTIDPNFGYAVALDGITKLYDPNIRSIVDTLSKQSYADKDTLVMTIRYADSNNQARRVNPFTDPVSIAMVQAGIQLDIVNTLTKLGNELGVSKEDAYTAYYYGNYRETKVTDQQCIDYVNTKMPLTSDNVKDIKLLHPVNTKIMQKILLAMPSLKVLLNTFPAIKKAYKEIIADTISTDANGNTTIVQSPMCLQNPEMCKSICLELPEQCADDQTQRCQRPEYRYKDKFLNTESFDNEECCMANLWILILLAFIIIGGSFAVFKWLNKCSSRGYLPEQAIDQENNTPRR